jgi:hypothetical protein
MQSLLHITPERNPLVQHFLHIETRNPFLPPSGWCPTPILGLFC